MIVNPLGGSSFEISKKTMSNTKHHTSDTKLMMPQGSVESHKFSGQK